MAVAAGLTWSSLVLYLYLVTTIAHAFVPVTTPMANQFIAINSDENITYTCNVDAGRTVVWEVERSQIRNQRQFDDATSIGIFIDPMNTDSVVSTITVSGFARRNNSDNEIIVQCLASQGISSVEGERYIVISFDPPEPVSNLDILPSLMLVWDRPTNVPSEVNITYTVEINSTDGSMSFQNITSETTFSVHFLEEMLPAIGSQCVEFEFFVSATNDAGTSPAFRILDTVPISPDVTVISNQLRVERVNLQSSEVAISFPPVQPCSSNFPLTNYTLNIDGAVSRVLLSSEIEANTPVIDATLQGLTRDRSFSLTVTACNDVTCRTSNSRTINTTDVQSVEAVFFGNRLFLRCSFADNTQARGCIVNLILSSTNETERFEVARQGSSGSMCTTANNQREVYGSVVVQDWEVDGGEGNVTLNITNRVVNTTSLEQYRQLTGCQEVVEPNRTAAIVGGVFGALVIMLIVVVVIVLIVLFVLGSKKKTRQEVYASTLERRERTPLFNIRSDGGDEERAHLMADEFECEVGAGEECAKMMKSDLVAASTSPLRQDSIPSAGPHGVELSSLPSIQENTPAYIEHHDDPDQPLTIKVRWKTLVQTLAAINSLKPDAKPLITEGKDLSKVKVRLDMT